MSPLYILFAEKLLLHRILSSCAKRICVARCLKLSLLLLKQIFTRKLEEFVFRKIVEQIEMYLKYFQFSQTVLVLLDLIFCSICIPGQGCLSIKRHIKQTVNGLYSLPVHLFHQDEVATHRKKERILLLYLTSLHAIMLRWSQDNTDLGELKIPC